MAIQVKSFGDTSAVLSAQDKIIREQTGAIEVTLHHLSELVAILKEMIDEKPEFAGYQARLDKFIIKT